MTDYIDRQAAIEAIERLILPQTKGETAAEEINRVAWRCAINCAEEMIGHLPSAEVEPVKRGKWIKTDNPSSSPFVPGSEWVYICSECECAFDDDWNYCPNCGARMKPISASPENGQEQRRSPDEHEAHEGL